MHLIAARHFAILPLLIGIQAAAPACAAEPAATDVTPGEKLFALRVQTLFVEKCHACHGADPDDLGGEFDMRDRISMRKGGESFGGEVLLPGDAKKSHLYLVTTRQEAGYEMPPKEAEKLTEEQTWWIRDWINLGAPWPSDERIAAIKNEFAEGVTAPTSGGLNANWTNRRYEPEHLWAYQPIEVESVPSDQHPIDYFIDRRLAAAKLTAAADAEPMKLLRRISFDLTGLPPSEDLASRTNFVESYELNAAGAVTDLVQRLMSTPHYGEHFGRQWLDVARYADSAGFANDYSRPNAWRYRDYVVRAFNNDKPYDQFVREQIAGDEITTASPESLVATGFLRMGPWEQTGMSVFRVTRQQWLDDVTDSVGQVFMGHALQCAKCHDHKFDPVPTRDYYSMMAIFSTTQFSEPATPFLDSENQTGFQKSNQWTTAKITAYQKQLDELQATVGQARRKETGNAKIGDNGLSPGDEASLGRMRKNIGRHTWELDRTRPIAYAVHTGKTFERKNVSNRLRLPQNVWGEGYIEDDTILVGGDAFTRGESVKPAPLSAAVNLGNMDVKEFPAGKGKRRLALANWIVDPKNPLTARVMVNRIWSWHFGKGIAGNPNNFGGTGRLPTHPALLDFLADWFVKNNWSVKRLNELIVTSKAYRRSSRHHDPAELKKLDPKQALYATQQPRRLTAEELRDAMLAASGELNRQIGGIPCRPDLNLEVAMQPRQIMGGTASVYEPDASPQQRNRRTLYAEKTRGLRDPFMETFNQPGPDKSCELRETSTVAPQALTLMNSDEAQDRAIAMAARLLKQGSSPQDVLKRAFEIALGRQAQADELQACLAHWNAATKEETLKTYQPRHYPSETQRTVMAEKTGEPYEFLEIMPAYDHYVPDLQPSDVDANTRGLAQVCLVIFNLNEFAYLD
ncbi:MAG: PSD1 and planctomycete cytochrome C domain-containing protein [Rubripirellula sp.]|nr:PSD1 and planctomycete cytochrome C domain-containing protein [Rubripirellula sp.]